VHADPENWFVDVWNQGENLSGDQLAQIFDKFVRLRRREGLVQGTGLGLFITREIIRKHGGDIQAHCEGDNWIKFCITLPIGRTKPASQESEMFPGKTEMRV
jgi:K+-sensing histidine kinase KdpD